MGGPVRNRLEFMRMASTPVYGLYRLWCSTIRYTEVNRVAIEHTTDQGLPVVLCLWHDELFPLIYLKRQLRIIALVSQSGDGELLAGVLERMGLETARGSSTRGGMKALLAAARRMRQDGLCGCVTVDGPRGPRHEVKEGAIFLAGRAAAPIVPIRLFMTRRKVFRSWDRFQLPWPFSRVAMVCGDAYRFTGDIRDPEQIAAACRELEARLNALQPPKSFLPGVPMSVSSPSPFPEESSRAGFLPRACYRLARILSGLGFSGVRKVGRGLGLLFWTCLPSRRRLAVSNICSHLGYPYSRAGMIARESFNQNAESFLECVLAPEFGMEHPLLCVERPDLLERLKTEMRPAVITTGHFGAWELLASLLGDLPQERPRITVVRRYRNAVLHYVTTRLRSSRGAQVIGHREAAFPVLRALRQKGYVAFLVDHNTGRSEAVFLPFLGEEAAVNKGPALLAVRAKALIWPIFLLRKDGKYVLSMDDPLDTATLEGDTDEKIEAAARFYTEAVAKMIRRAPEQWFWMHNRWKTRR